MKSYEVLKQAADVVGVKALAAKLKLSPALVYKWCQEFDPNDPDVSGARNPLDRLADIVEETGDIEVVQWLCHQAGGFFARNPRVAPGKSGTELLMNTQRLVQEFSELLMTVTRSIEDDGCIGSKEAESIRNSWEDFKGIVEEFSVACEQGLFAQPRTSRPR